MLENVSEPTPAAHKQSRRDSDQAYVLDLCDELLGQASEREKRFPFLTGDPGKSGRGASLPVDAYYPELKLVIEYREIQHSKPVAFFDKPSRMTVSGVHRGEQRALYDQRRREVLPRHGIRLVEIDCSIFSRTSQDRLKRDRQADRNVLRELLAAAGFAV